MSRPMTLSEKILSRKAGRPVQAGEFLLLPVDVALANDITAPVAIAEFRKAGGTRVRHPERVVLVADHFTPNKDIASAEQVRVMRRFAREQGIGWFYDVGRMGIEHVLLPEDGLVKAGDLVVGADSHTCTYGALGALACGVGSTDLAGVFFTGMAWLMVPETIRIELHGEFRRDVGAKDLILHVISRLGVDGATYRALEFCGPGVAGVSLEGRLTVSNMAVECGAKTGLFPVDEISRQWQAQHGTTAEPLAGDADARCLQTLRVDLDDLPAQVAYPHLPSNCRDIEQAAADEIAVDQVVIGSCTNGRLEDLRAAAAVLRGRRVHRDVRCLVIPGSQAVYRHALREGLIEIFLDAECAVSTPSCGPCLGGHLGILAAGERALATTNRNFVGRMGHAQSEVYLASPVTAAATAVAGRIRGPHHLPRSTT